MFQYVTIMNDSFVTFLNQSKAELKVTHHTDWEQGLCHLVFGVFLILEQDIDYTSIEVLRTDLKEPDRLLVPQWRLSKSSKT